MAKRKKTNKNSRPTDEAPSPPALAGIARPLTLVAQVEQTLRNAIEESAFPGGRLPTLVELADQLRVSRETVRLALESLQQEGLIEKRRRRGTFVSSSSVPASLSTPKPNVLGYLLEEYDYEGADSEVVVRPHGSAMLEGVVVEAGRHGYQLIARSAKPFQLREAFDELQALGPIQGAIFACVGEEKFLKGLSGRGLPAVLLDHELHLPNIGSIRGDSEQNARLAVRHLAELGHRSIACAQWHQCELNPWFLRGYRQGMRDAGLRRRKAWEMLVELNQKGADDAMDQLMALPRRPTSIVCFHNTFASQLITAAWERGLEIPNDLSVVGGGGERVANLSHTQIDWHELGRESVRMVLRAIEDVDQAKPEHILVPYDLNNGGTVAPIDTTTSDA